MRTITYNNTQLKPNIKMYEDEKQLEEMTLSQNTVNLSDQLKEYLKDKKKSDLPFIEEINGEKVLDQETIIQINNKTTSEQKEEIIQDILDKKNLVDVRAYLLENSPEPVVGFTHDLILRNQSNEVLMENVLYPIGNILVYTVEDATGLSTVKAFIVSLKESMYIINSNKMISALSNQIVESNQYIEGVKTLTDQSIQQNTVDQNLLRGHNLEQTNILTKYMYHNTLEKMNQNTLFANNLADEMGWKNQENIEKLSKEFQKKVDETLAATRGMIIRRMVLAGGSYAVNAALTHIGLPPVGIINGIVSGISAASQYVGVFSKPVPQTPGIVEILKTIPDFFN